MENVGLFIMSNNDPSHRTVAGARATIDILVLSREFLHLEVSCVTTSGAQSGAVAGYHYCGGKASLS